MKRSDISINRAGFTLVELLVVIGIILVLAGMVIGMVRFNLDADRIPYAARQVQSALEGARDRAIHAKAPRGVRFILNSSPTAAMSDQYTDFNVRTGYRTAASLVYIQPTSDWTTGTIQMQRLDADRDSSPDSDLTGDGVADTDRNIVCVIAEKAASGSDPVVPIPTEWHELYASGLLVDGLRIKIPDTDAGVWYVISTKLLAQDVTNGTTGQPPRLLLTSAYATSAKTANNTVSAFDDVDQPTTYRLQRAASVIPGEIPSMLNSQAVLHLDRSSATPDTATARGNRLPTDWRISSSLDPTGFIYNQSLDIMFGPNGTIVGPAASRGIIHLYVGHIEDALKDQQNWLAGNASTPEYKPDSDTSDSYQRRDRLLVSIFTRTGAIIASAIDAQQANTATGTLYDPFRQAETGQEVQK